jgi:hypothetical protein
VRGGIGRHLLEPRACPQLALPAALGRRARPIQALDQVVADLFELGHVRYVALGAKQGVGGLPGLARVARVGGQMRLEAGDLAAELLATHSLVGRDLGHLGLRWDELLTEITRTRAARIDRPRQVARVDAVFTGVLDRLRGEALQVRRAGSILRDERPEAVARGDQAVVHQPPVDRPGGVDVHPGPAGQLAYAG